MKPMIWGILEIKIYKAFGEKQQELSYLVHQLRRSQSDFGKLNLPHRQNIFRRLGLRSDIYRVPINKIAYTSKSNNSFYTLDKKAISDPVILGITTRVVGSRYTYISTIYHNDKDFLVGQKYKIAENEIDYTLVESTNDKVLLHVIAPGVGLLNHPLNWHDCFYWIGNNYMEDSTQINLLKEVEMIREIFEDIREEVEGINNFFAWAKVKIVEEMEKDKQKE